MVRNGERGAGSGRPCGNRLNANLVTVRATNCRGVIYERTKTRAGTRLVPLFGSVRKMLVERELRLEPERTRPDAFVFANEFGGPLDPGNFRQREWLRALKAAAAFDPLREIA